MSGNKFFGLKLRSVYVGLFLLAVILMLFAFRWQIVDAQKFSKIAEGRIFTSELTSLRGSIYSKDGTTLAYSEPRFHVYIWMQDVLFFEKIGNQTREEFIQKVAPLIDTTPEQLRNRINEYQNSTPKIDWFRIASSVSSDTWKKLNDLRTDKNLERKLAGLSFQNTSKRIYPENRLASHIIGLTNVNKNEVFGVSGLESSWNGALNPKAGLLRKESDAIGQSISSGLIATVEPKPGSSVYTTIDKRLQMIVEEETKKAVERFKAKSGTIVIIDPKNGEVMAFANFPDYNPNLREETDPAVYTNYGVSSPYEIGSVAKIFTLASAIDAGLVKPDTVVLPEGHQGTYKICEDNAPQCTIRTWNAKPQPPMPASQCFTASDNICFYKIADLLGPDLFYNYLQKFGVGLTSTSDLSEESISYLKQPGRWDPTDIATYSYGHGYLMNALQALASVSTIANDGIRMKPMIVKKEVKGDGREIIYDPVAMNDGKSVISKESAAIMQEIMHMAYLADIRDYEYWYQDLKNYKIGMKSGTGLIAEGQQYSEDVNVTQVGLDLSPERKFAMLVKLERPEGGQVSFYNSRIMWLDTFAAIKDYLKVPRK